MSIYICFYLLLPFLVMGYVYAFLIPNRELSKWGHRSERKVSLLMADSDNAFSFFNGTMQRLQSQIALSKGGLNDINTIIMESYVYVDERLPYISSGSYPTMEDLVSCKQVQMVNERNEFVFAFYNST